MTTALVVFVVGFYLALFAVFLCDDPGGDPSLAADSFHGRMCDAPIGAWGLVTALVPPLLVLGGTLQWLRQRRVRPFLVGLVATSVIFAITAIYVLTADVTS